jgi:hypothetical protein
VHRKVLDALKVKDADEHRRKLSKVTVARKKEYSH